MITHLTTLFDGSDSIFPLTDVIYIVSLICKLLNVITCEELLV